jgi:predicted transcriptional regulator
VARTGDLADANYCTVSHSTEVAVLTDLMRKVRVALVLEGKKLTGILTRFDIIDHVARMSSPNV